MSWKMSISFINPFGYLLRSYFCDQKKCLLNKMRQSPEDPRGVGAQVFPYAGSCMAYDGEVLMLYATHYEQT